MYIINEWLRYLDNPEEEREPAWEYELRCRVHLIGEIDIGWAKFRFWEIPSLKVKTDIRSVVLRMRFREANSNEYLQVPDKKDQHFHPKGGAGEFENLISLFTRAHFVLVKGSSTGELPLLRRFARREHIAFSDVDGSNIDLREVQHYFTMLRIIRESELREIRKNRPSERYVKKFIMAARFYHLALSLIEHDETLAYLCLSSSIECMLSGYKPRKFSLEDLNPEAYELLSKTKIKKAKLEAIEKAILKYEPKIKVRFASFIQDHISDAFWEDKTRPGDPFQFKDEKDILEYARRIYDARSNAIHSGEPFPSSVYDEEHPIGCGMQIGQKQWNEKEMIPSARAFERLVHHVLLESLRKQHSLVQDQ